jgi:hypothetical protein
MSFHKTKSKIETANLSIKALSVWNSGADYRSKFSAANNSVNSIWDTLKSEGKNLDGFKKWKEEKWIEIINDDLLKKVRDWRIFDYHTGYCPLQFDTHISSAQLSGPLTIGSDGLYKIKNLNTPDEERVPITKNAIYTTVVSVENPPKSHLGKMLEEGKPEEYLSTALKYYKNLVFEVSSKHQK